MISEAVKSLRITTAGLPPKNRSIAKSGCGFIPRITGALRIAKDEIPAVETTDPAEGTGAVQTLCPA